MNEKESTLDTDKPITHVGGLQAPRDLWGEFKAEAHEKDLNRSELLLEILEERYGNGKGG